jgi:hypothetical protein
MLFKLYILLVTQNVNSSPMILVRNQTRLLGGASHNQ